MLVRAVTSVLLLVGVLALQDAAVDRVTGDRWCLSYAVAQQSPQLADLLCFTVGVDGPQPALPWTPASPRAASGR